jgi:hypothetical protein
MPVLKKKKEQSAMKSELVSLGNYICPTSVKACQSLNKKIQDYKKKRCVEARSCDFFIKRFEQQRNNRMYPV